MEKKRLNTFNQTAYEEFARSEVATRAQKMIFDGIDATEDPGEMRRDVRASKYKENDNSWSPSKRQKRKTLTEVPEGNMETTSNRQERKVWERCLKATWKQ
ncbi:unnamed protein product [Cylicocyclus nassatus]|uniref:Uncharacterized protein n=1 Tax=Cylicocyclus nassatus TaxID=53992 RepID=A0AA36HEH7_CYLNA|nr:unnamed protein product [Cylicocyclus nassatus]